MSAPTATDLEGQRLSDWIEQVGISRSTAYELLRLTGTEPQPRRVAGSRKPVSHLLPAHLAVLNPLAQQLAEGITLPQIRRQLADAPAAPADRKRAAAVPSAAPPAGAEQPPPPSDPLRCVRLLTEAAALAVALSSDELADITGFAPATVRSWRDGHPLRPGFRLRKQKQRNAVWWKVERLE